MEQKHKTSPLDWLDKLISITLNPARKGSKTMTLKEAEEIMKQLEDSNDEILAFIKSQAFAIRNEQKVRAMIRKMHFTFIVFIDQVYAHQKSQLTKSIHLKTVFKTLVNYLNSFLTFIETRFMKYISLDERSPAIYVDVTKKEIRQKLDQLNNQPGRPMEDESSFEIVLKGLSAFANDAPLTYEVTFRDIIYKKGLMKGLQDLPKEIVKTGIYSNLDELLIYLNYNSKQYMNRLTSRVAQKINEATTPIEKMDKLLYYYKAFNQLHRKPGISFNPKYHDLDTIMSNWFVQEILYLEKKMHLSVMPLQKIKLSQQEEQPAKVNQKIMCMLSTDQTALILRAADDLRLLIAKSMSEVFKTIVPHLSTPNKTELSYDGMRSKAYSPEEKDKQRAIEALERMIKKIKDY